MLNKRWSHNHLSSNMGIPIPREAVFILRQGPVFHQRLRMYLLENFQGGEKNSHNFNISLDTDGLVQDSSNSSASAMGLLQSCTKPSKWTR